MARRKLCYFIMLSMIVGILGCGRLNSRNKEPDSSKLNKRLLGPALAANASLGYSGQPTDDAFHTNGNVLPTAVLPVQIRNVKGLGAGKLLVASRDLADPNFAQTVVLLVQYDTQGVVGLILNRRTDIPLSRVLESLKAAKDRSDLVYLGGPVETPTVFALFRSPNKMEGAERIFGGVYLISTKTLFEQTISTRPDPGVFHVYLGYAGWTDELLRKEVELGAWFIFPADADTVFNSDPDSLWSQMIRKTELKFATSGRADADPMHRVLVNQ